MLRRIGAVALVLGAFWAGPAHASNWCGVPTTVDRAPQLVGGDTVHVVYATPSDGGDRFSTLSSAIETDGEAIDTWWRGQDPTRTPRFDRFPFACGAQLDIADVKLTQTGPQLADASTAFTMIASDLQNAGFVTGWVKSIVYYDGPVANPDICGIGGGSLTGTGIAIVFVNGCVGVPSAWTAAHELGHALGAVGPGAPHLCADAHVCDSTTDLMYPFAVEGRPLSAAILDVGRDDYYGHSGTQTDIQDSAWLQHLDSQAHLTVSIAGAGRVQSDVPGVDCTATCGTDWDGGSAVSLTATAGDGLRFAGWTGDCTGAADCPLTMDAAKTVSALFVPATYRLRVTVAGRGTVASKPRGIACKPRCSAAFPSLAPVKLTAKPAKGWKLKAWSGGCKGTKALCSLPMRAAASARALFVRRP